MKKKHLIIVGTIIISAIVILGLYQTFALSGDITKDTSGYYNVTVNDGTTVNVPANSSKTVYYKLTNANKGIVKYGVGYSGSNITVKYYHDTQDPVTGTVDYGKSKFIKLYIQNTGSTATTATLSTILGYEKGGDLIVPSGYTLITEEKTLLSEEVLEMLNLDAGEMGSDEDDLGTSYYFVDTAENNYVYFAGYYWRIIRINGNGTIRIIYQGPTYDSTGQDATIGTGTFMNGNANIGYMIGTAGATTYADTHSNSTDSENKRKVDQWYKENIASAGYGDYVADAIYCNDRSLYSGTGIGTSTTEYAFTDRLNNASPTLKCLNINDRFTKSSKLGNGKLTYPVGLITADELMYAGAGNDSNTYIYLYINYPFYTMTPLDNGTIAAFTYSAKIGMDSSTHVDGSLRPVISLKGYAIISGTGTADNPFKVK